MNSALLALLGARVAAAPPAGDLLTLADSFGGSFVATNTVSWELNLGAASAGHEIVVLGLAQRDAARTISSITLNGIALTADVTNQSRGGIYIARGPMPAGGTGTLTITANTTGLVLAAAVYLASRPLAVASTATAVSDGTTASMTATLNPAGEVVVAGAVAADYPAIGVTIAGASAGAGGAAYAGGLITPSGSPHGVVATLASPGTANFARLAAVAYQSA